MRHPIQRLHLCLANSRLYTATSNSLHAFDLLTGKLVDSWSAPVPLISRSSSTAPPPTTATTATTKAKQINTNDFKKRKIEEPTSPPVGTKRKTRQSLFAGHESNNAIAKVLSTRDGKYVITATHEDKTVRVLSHAGSSGALEVVSTRILPKRIVDLALIENDSTILCADKFGDVFGFPVIQPESDLSTSKTAKPIAPQSPSSPPPNVSKAELAGYTPDQVKRHYEKVANYTERERIAAERRKRTEIDYNLPFSHNFVLGHVSMLLSLITVTLPADHPQTAGKERTWILTSDRDEHIRVSRFPQSFVIDGFCLGHTSFVKAMITPSWESTILISGGGDEYLLVWNWREGNVVQKVDLMSTVQEVIGLQPSSPSKEVQEGEERDEDDGFKMAVSGMWELPDIRCILVGIESVPALFLFTYHSSIEGLRYSSTLPLQGKILDVAVDSRENTAYVSVDPSGADSPLLGVYRINNNGITWESIQPEFAKHVTGEVEKSVDLPADLVAAVRANVLYPVVGLRKDFGTFKAEEE